MTHVEIAKKLYPGETQGYFCACDYQPIIDYLGTVVVQKDEDRYQGDTWVLFEDTGKGYGYLSFGWGSCSGCDALQACRGYEEIANLIKGLESEVKWAPRDEMLAFFRGHDWEGDYSFHFSDMKEFVKEAVAYLEAQEKGKEAK